MGFWKHSNGTRSLTHSLTRFSLIYSLRSNYLNTLLLPPLRSITFVPSAFYAYVWHILEGTSKAYIFSRHKRVRDNTKPIFGWLRPKWRVESYTRGEFNRTEFKSFKKEYKLFLLDSQTS